MLDLRLEIIGEQFRHLLVAVPLSNCFFSSYGFFHTPVRSRSSSPSGGRKQQLAPETNNDDSKSIWRLKKASLCFEVTIYCHFQKHIASVLKLTGCAENAALNEFNSIFNKKLLVHWTETLSSNTFIGHILFNTITKTIVCVFLFVQPKKIC